MKRGKDKAPRTMKPQSLANLDVWEKVRPVGFDDVLVRVYLPQAVAKAWRRLSPTERGEWVKAALELREKGG